MSWLSGLFGGGKSSTSDLAAYQRQQEEERQARITQGTKDINDRFAGYNDAFYNSAAQKYRDWLNPQIDQQYKDAQQGTLFALARNGQMNSSVGADQAAKILQVFQNARLQAEQKAQGAASQMRGNIENARADALSLLSSTADPQAAAAVATARANAASQTPAYDTMGNIFGAATGLLANNEIVRNVYGAPGMGFSIFGNRNNGKVYGG